MNITTPPGRSHSFARPLLLVALLAGGLASIWHLAENLIPQQQRGRSSPPASATPPAANPEASAPTSKTASDPVARPAPPSTPSEGGGPAGVKSPPAGPLPSAERPGPSGAKRADAPLPTPKPTLDAATLLKAHGGRMRLVQGPDGKVIATDPILFNSGRTEIRSISLRVLDDLASFLKSQPGLRLSIVGHTDNLGPEATNLKVSADRAAAVRQYLASKGIDQARLHSSGMGSKQPITSNSTQLGRQANRRIEFVLVPDK